MTTDTQRQSAKIYEFPARGRFAVQRRDNNAASSAATRVPKVASGGAWYHDEAIKEAERADE